MRSFYFLIGSLFLTILLNGRKSSISLSPKKALRENYIVTLAITISAFGKLGRFFFDNDSYKMQDYLPKLQQIDWLRSNNMWIGRTIRDNGKVLNSEEAISLTCAVIKREIGLPLTKEEKQKEKQISEKM